MEIEMFLENFFREIEAFSEKLKLFQGLQGFLNTFLVELFKVM
jgi:hypothetical protein